VYIALISEATGPGLRIAITLHTMFDCLVIAHYLGGFDDKSISGWTIE